MKRLLFLTIIVFTTITYSQKEAITEDGKKVILYENGSWVFANSDDLTNIKTTTVFKLEIPKIEPKETIVSHFGYSLSYNETHEQANWVAYELTARETIKVYERTNKFLKDSKVRTRTAEDKDYKGSGYDRGHLAPAGDMSWSKTAMKESFYYSNISPQNPSFNRGIWKRLEELVRTWAIDNESVFIVTAPVLTTGLGSIGRNKVSVPKYFYKVILDYKEPDVKGIGFIIPNEKSSSKDLKIYAVSIDKVEEVTGIDFFPSLPDRHENIIESTLEVDSWTWNSSNTSGKKKNLNVSVQCSGITKAGARCKNKTLNINGYCYHHEDQISNNKSTTSPNPITPKSQSSTVQCTGITKAGARCKRKTTNSSGRCYQH